jgi:hypothetical protein
MLNGKQKGLQNQLKPEERPYNRTEQRCYKGLGKQLRYNKNRVFPPFLGLGR